MGASRPIAGMGGESLEEGLPCFSMLGDLGLREQHSGLMAEDWSLGKSMEAGNE